ncbi:hypothetical protein BV20DRAFT_443065 [Pilatotrama ljubarskyi]|nr:hypothetical protein BV20DRAFT_443065 [Pilatotrama ljubarskyi]
MILVTNLWRTRTRLLPSSFSCCRDAVPRCSRAGQDQAPGELECERRQKIGIVAPCLTTYHSRKKVSARAGGARGSNAFSQTRSHEANLLGLRNKDYVRRTDRLLLSTEEGIKQRPTPSSLDHAVDWAGRAHRTGTCACEPVSMPETGQKLRVPSTTAQISSLAVLTTPGMFPCGRW